MTIFIADDHTLFRKGLIRILAEDASLEILGEAGDGVAALEAIRTLHPDVALLDVSMPGHSGLDIAQTLQQERHPTKVVILTMYKGEAYLNRALDLGVKGYILKESAVSDLIDCLKAIAEDHYYISPVLSEFLVRRHTRSKAFLQQNPGLAQLTEMERRILYHIAQNKTSRQIADELFISYRTVQTHRNNICHKLGLKGYHKLLQFALENKANLPPIN